MESFMLNNFTECFSLGVSCDGAFSQKFLKIYDKNKTADLSILSCTFRMSFSVTVSQINLYTLKIKTLFLAKLMN